MVYFDLPPQPLPIAQVEMAQSPAKAQPKDGFLDRLLTASEAELSRLPPKRPEKVIILTQGSLAQSQVAQGQDSELPTLEPPAQTPERLEPERFEPEIEPVELEVEPEATDGPVQIEIEAEEPLSPTDTAAEFASQLQLSADYQSYDPSTQIVSATGSVLLRVNDAIIEADELWVNLINRYALANGNVLLTRGAQIVRGNRAEYNFIQQAGTIGDAVGTLYLPDVSEDLSSPLEGPSSTSRRAYDPINRSPDFSLNSDGSIQIGTNNSTQPANTATGSGLRQLRFETDELAFDVEGWRADSVRITNDPFSPPELELRTDSLVLRNISPTQDELLLKRPRLVFDQGLSIPLLRSRILLSRGTVNPSDLNPIPVQGGTDGRDRGGLFLGRRLPLINTDSVRFSVTPQFFVARAFGSDSSSPIDANNFGLTADLSAQLTPRTTLRGDADLTSLNLSEITENLRTNIRAEQRIGDHRLTLQYSYRERLFNGSLGFQDVQSSLGAVLLSPDIKLNDRGLRLTYQAGAQLINAESDRVDLLAASGSDTGRITLGRYQGSAALRQSFNLWRGEPKPATQTEGLRYTPYAVVPYLDLNAGLRATGTYYSSGDFQDSVIADIGISGQVGHFARDFGDYTQFNVSYSQAFLGGADSPFLFDRDVDRSVLSFGITQQIYGPFLAGFQTAISLSNDSRDIDTIYSLEYSRRTYGIVLRYDATQSAGSIGFRLSSFSWLGDTNPFDTPRIRRVESGVIEQR
ncbi:MAG: DUF3769 domain-containing protein [Phormidesmis sp.]